MHEYYIKKKIIKKNPHPKYYMEWGFPFPLNTNTITNLL